MSLSISFFFLCLGVSKECKWLDFYLLLLLSFSPFSTGDELSAADEAIGGKRGDEDEEEEEEHTGLFYGIMAK